MTHQTVAVSKRRELLVFAFLAVVLFPVIAVGAVAGWGFLVWMWQLIAGQEAACSILLYEGSGTRELMDCIDAGQASPGVISVNLIYHHAEQREALEQPAARCEQTGASDDLAS